MNQGYNEIPDHEMIGKTLLMRRGDLWRKHLNHESSPQNHITKSFFVSLHYIRAHLPYCDPASQN